MSGFIRPDTAMVGYNYKNMNKTTAENVDKCRLAAYLTGVFFL
jgi:hypothetical protein